ncbi:NAD-dependent DNA ligase LigA [Candidatus Riesia pediculischaeffi]|nr:NAD-dependent DNA ligase LigA [Candidatus Riesia pediculischaeffi]
MKNKNMQRYLSHLKKKIKKYQRLYYVFGKSEIPDFEYDLMVQRLNNIEKNSAKQIHIVSDLKSGSNLVKHHSPMLSLRNTFHEDECLRFYRKVLKILNKKNEEIHFCCELKVDGLAVNLIYKNGRLHSASTRGNSILGEDIFSNVCRLKDIPLLIQDEHGYIPDLMEVRGEIFMKFKKFKDFNKHMKQMNGRTFSNPRSAAVGLIRKTCQKNLIKRFLNFFSYGFGVIKYNGLAKFYKDQFKSLILLKSWNFPIIENVKLCSSADEILEYYKIACDIRNQLCYGVDGIVIKVDSAIYQKILGYTSYAPKWSIAFKFPIQKKTTTLVDVIFQIGKTGTITPIAKINTISFNGIQFSRVTLHNMNFIKKLGIKIGDEIIVGISGDVIPKIIEKISSSTRQYSKEIISPKCCPSCYSSVHLEKNGKIRCMGGIVCDSQRESMINHFVSKKAMNIIGIGKVMVKNLVKKNIVRNPVDLYHLKCSSLLKIDRMTERSAKKIICSIEQSKNTTLDRFLYSLGIQGVGQVLSRTIANNFDYYRLFLRFSEGKCSFSDSSVKIGKSAASRIVSFFRIRSNREMFISLRKILNF